MNKLELIKKFEEDDELAECYFCEDNDPELDVLSQKLVDSYGGEGDGSTFYTVWEFKTPDETFYLRFDGFYASYSGAEYENLFEVFPEEVTRTEYKVKVW